MPAGLSTFNQLFSSQCYYHTGICFAIIVIIAELVISLLPHAIPVQYGCFLSIAYHCMYWYPIHTIECHLSHPHGQEVMLNIACTGRYR